MGANSTDDADDDKRRAMDPGPDTVDPAPLLGQVGEGATLESGEAISSAWRKLTERPNDDKAPDTEASISADPEMPIPSPDK